MNPSTKKALVRYKQDHVLVASSNETNLNFAHINVAHADEAASNRTRRRRTNVCEIEKHARSFATMAVLHRKREESY